MRKLLAIVLLWVCVVGAVVTSPGIVTISNELPSTCSPPRLHFNLAGTSGHRLHVCDDENTWVPLGAGEASGTLHTVIESGRHATGLNSFATAAKFSDGSGDGIAIYTHATDGPQINGFIDNVENDTDYYRKLNAGKEFGVKNSSSTKIFTVAEGTGAITNATINGEGTGNTITLTEEDWFPVAACQNTTASHIWDHATANFPAATCDTGSNTQKGYLAFDADTDEAIEGQWVLPVGFNPSLGIDIHFRWKIAATTNAVGWCFQMVRVPDGATSDPAYPAQAAGNCVSDTAKGTTLQENNATITDVTCSSCVAGDTVYWRLSRDANGGAVTDSATGDAFLMRFGRTWRVAH